MNIKLKLGFLQILVIILFSLKLSGVIKWSWLWVSLPVTIPLVIIVILLAIKNLLIVRHALGLRNYIKKRMRDGERMGDE